MKKIPYRMKTHINWTTNIGLKGLLTLVLGVCVIFDNIAVGQNQQWQIKSVPHASVSPSENIEYMDFIADGKQTLYLVWIFEGKVFFSKSMDSGEFWSNPVKIDRSVSKIKLIKTEVPVILHLFMDDGKAHLISSDEGVTWSEVNSITEDKKILAIDFLPNGSEFIVSYLAEIKSESMKSKKHLGVFISRWISHKNRVSSAELITTFVLPANTSDHSLKLSFHGKMLHILCAINKMDMIVTNNVTKYTNTSALYEIWSEDNGKNWFSARDLFADDSTQQINRPTYIKNINLLANRKNLIVFYHANDRLYAKMRLKEGHWSVGMDITNFVPRFLSSDFYLGEIASAAYYNSGVVIWVDSRFAKTDRRWWKPLGGWPWSDQPDWSNNDIFMVSVEGIQNTLQHNKPLIIQKESLHRITKPLSRASIVRIHAMNKQFVIMWIGHNQINKNKNFPIKNNDIFFLRIPISTLNSNLN